MTNFFNKMNNDYESGASINNKNKNKKYNDNHRDEEEADFDI